MQMRFANDARAVNKAHLLQQDVKIIHDGTANQKLNGTILHSVHFTHSLRFTWTTGVALLPSTDHSKY